MRCIKLFQLIYLSFLFYIDESLHFPGLSGSGEGYFILFSSLSCPNAGPSSAFVLVTYDKLAEYRKPPSALLRRAVETSLELIAYNFMKNGKN